MRFTFWYISLPSPAKQQREMTKLYSRERERMTAKSFFFFLFQIHGHLVCNNLYPVAQSAYRRNHSTETALLKVMNDILLNMNRQHVTILVLLDLSAAFDSVDHSILLNRLSSKLGLNGTALAWFLSYLSGRSQRVSVRGAVSDKFDLRYGVPQGSCLGPLFFTVYASALFDVVEKHLPTVHCYADDSQLYISFSPKAHSGQADAVASIEHCIQDIRQWMSQDKLLMNESIQNGTSFDRHQTATR